MGYQVDRGVCCAAAKVALGNAPQGLFVMSLFIAPGSTNLGSRVQSDDTLRGNFTLN
jgi:hypothetical protein